MKFLLDTNIISEIRKQKPHGGVLSWSEAYAPDAYVVPSVAIFELQMGAQQLRLQDPVRAESFDLWIERIVSRGAVLPLDAAAARETARMLEKQSLNLIADAMIAAIAKVNGLTVATRNTRDFGRFGVALVDPFSFKG